MRAANKAAAKKSKRHEVDENGRRRNAKRKARRLLEKKADSMPVVELTGPKLERHVDAELIDPSPKGGLREVFDPQVVEAVFERQPHGRGSQRLPGRQLFAFAQTGFRFPVPARRIASGRIRRIVARAPVIFVHTFDDN